MLEGVSHGKGKYMNPSARFLQTIRGERADRVPLHLPGFHARTREEIDTWPDPRRRAIAERIFDETHFEAGVPSHINRMLVTPPQRIHTEKRTLPKGEWWNDGVIETPKGSLTFQEHSDPVANTVWQTKYPVESLEDIEKIAAVAWELPEGLHSPEDNILKDDPAGRGIVTTGVSSPFVCAAGMMPYQMFLELCATHQDLLLELTEICRKRILDCLAVLFSKPGIEYVWMGGSEWLTPPMGSAALYAAFVQEQERSIIDFIKARGDAVVHIHCHGNIRQALEPTIARGGDYTEPVEPPPGGDITLSEAKQLAAGRITLGGNVECRLLQHGSEDEVEVAARAAFEGGKERFILRTSEGPSPELSEQEFRNYMRMIDVWEALGEIR